MKRLTRLLTVALLAISIVASMVVGASAIELKTGIGIVETNGLRLRAKPNTDAEILANASYGDNVVIIREVDGWYLVDYNLMIGYMSADYITFKEKENVELGYGVVEDASVNMRDTPSSDGALLAQLSTGDTAYIIGLNCGWYKVQYEGMTGYIRSDLLALTEPVECNQLTEAQLKSWINILVQRQQKKITVIKKRPPFGKSQTVVYFVKTKVRVL